MVEEYIEEYKITVPDYCESILQIFEENPDEKVTEKDIIKENFQHLQSEVNHNFHPENLHIENYRHENLITDSFNTYNELGIHPENPSAKFIPILPNNINNINQIHQN